MRRQTCKTCAVLVPVIAGLFIGGLLKIADRFGVMPWLIGFILASFSYNVLRWLERLPSQKVGR